MPRANHIQKAERLNLARTLLQRYQHWPEAAQQLARKCSISERQAYRYLEQAQRLKHPVPVGDAKVSFTIKLSRRLTATPRLRRFDRIDLKRDRQPCLLGGTASRGRSWLSRRAVSHEPSIWNIASTDYCRTSWFRPTTCSHRTGTGWLLQVRSPQAARRW